MPVCVTLYFVQYLYCLLPIVGSLLLSPVSLQDPVEIIGVVGDFVIMPCSYHEGELKPEDINVFWRNNKSKIVYDIVLGSPLTKRQDAVFKGRILSFPSEYVKGNFSIRLSNLMHTDPGQFSCFIPGVRRENKHQTL